MREEVTGANLAGWFRGGSVVMLCQIFLLSILIHELDLTSCYVTYTKSATQREKQNLSRGNSLS